MERRRRRKRQPASERRSRAAASWRGARRPEEAIDPTEIDSRTGEESAALLISYQSGQAELKTLVIDQRSHDPRDPPDPRELLISAAKQTLSDLLCFLLFYAVSPQAADAEWTGSWVEQPVTASSSRWDMQSLLRR